MADKLDIKALKNRVASIQALAAGLELECRQTMKLLDEADVSTSTEDNRLSKIALEARTRLRARLLKQ